jgi:hypothetical protein
MGESSLPDTVAEGVATQTPGPAHSGIPRWPASYIPAPAQKSAGRSDRSEEVAAESGNRQPRTSIG